MAKKKAKRKKRAKEYEPKVSFTGSFGQIIRVAVGKGEQVKKELKSKK